MPSLPPRKLRTLAAATLAVWTLSRLTAPAFTVVKNVNDGKPIEEKLVIFDKTKGHDAIQLSDPTGNSQMAFDPDGSINVTITGQQEIKPTIRWQAGHGLPESFDARQYTYLLITCALPGDIKQTFNGKTSPIRGDNLWYGAVFLNSKGETAGYCSFADSADDHKTPATMTALKIPTVLLTQVTDADTSKITGLVFPWNKTHENQNRDFHFIIEKIALAN